MLCKKELIRLKSTPSPFERLIALGWYDGPTSGVAECRTSDQSFAFEKLAWDEEQDQRLYLLKHLPKGSFSELLLALSGLGPPQWPEWVPKWEFDSREVQAAVDSRVGKILDRARGAEYVVQARDVMDELTMLAHLRDDSQRRAVDALATRNTSFGEWLIFLASMGS